MNKTTHIGLLLAALLLALPAQAGGQREEAMSANVRCVAAARAGRHRGHPHCV